MGLEACHCYGFESLSITALQLEERTEEVHSGTGFSSVNKGGSRLSDWTNFTPSPIQFTPMTKKSVEKPTVFETLKSSLRDNRRSLCLSAQACNLVEGMQSVVKQMRLKSIGYVGTKCCWNSEVVASVRRPKERWSMVRAGKGLRNETIKVQSWLYSY